MKVGVNLLNFGPGVSPSTLLQWAQVAEALGYHSVMISDHIALTPDVRERYPEPFYDPFVALSWLAGQTHALALGTTVCVLPYRSPLQVARMVANLDQLSGGRFIFGVGLGGVELEFAALGVPYHRRGACADDYLAAMKVLWTNDVASYQGEFVSFDEVTGPRPVQQPHPPIWVGGRSDAALRRAVRFGDGWHPNRFTLGWLRDTGLPRLRQMAQEAGRTTPDLCPRIRMRLTEGPLPEDGRMPGEGSLEQVRRDLYELQELDARHVLLDWYSGDLEATRHHETGWRMLSVLAEQVLDLRGESLR